MSIPRATHGFAAGLRRIAENYFLEAKQVSVRGRSMPEPHPGLTLLPYLHINWLRLFRRWSPTHPPPIWVVSRRCTRFSICGPDSISATRNSNAF